MEKHSLPADLRSKASTAGGEQAWRMADVGDIILAAVTLQWHASVPAKPSIENYVALGTRPRWSVLPTDRQRHITRGATKELLCGRPHNSSQTHCGPSGSFDTGRRSGPTKPALVLGNERNGSE